MAIGEELSDISRLLTYKEKSLCQAENARNYKLCEKVTEELMALKTRRRELEVEKRLLVTSQPHSLSPASSTTLSVVSSQSSTNELKHITSLLSPTSIPNMLWFTYEPNRVQIRL